MVFQNNERFANILYLFLEGGFLKFTLIIIQDLNTTLSVVYDRFKLWCPTKFGLKNHNNWFSWWNMIGKVFCKNKLDLGTYPCSFPSRVNFKKSPSRKRYKILMNISLFWKPNHFYQWISQLFYFKYYLHWWLFWNHNFWVENICESQ